MNPQEGSTPIYPTQLFAPRRGELTSHRDGIFGDPFAGQQSYGQLERPWKNGIFGPALGQSAEAAARVDGPLHAFRDGLFNRIKLAELPPGGAERVTAFHDGIFGGSVGQADEEGAPLDMRDPAVVQELTTILNFLAVPSVNGAVTISSEWTDEHSSTLESLAEEIGASAGVDPAKLVQVSNGAAYPTAAFVSMGYGLILASPTEKPPLALVTEWINRCVAQVPTGNNGSFSPDQQADAVNQACAVIPPEGRLFGISRANMFVYGGIALAGVGILYLALRRR